MKALRSLAACAVSVLLATSSFGAIAQKFDPARVPEEMRTQQGLYLLPVQAHQFVRAQKGKVLFIDVRTRAEAQFLGMATPVDALVPYVEFQEFMTDWDETRGFYKLEPFSDFVPEVGRRLQAKGLTKSDPVVLICRAGERSSRAANLLADSGYTRVYTVVYGFEGQLSDKGRRTVNGWKNANLPWSFELDKSKMYFPR
ncbi:MAG TPA: rhodanese-like domain-containing protein [Burkholderiaceae bacterium]|nr:rhodanese-like domain-containing protein [Burkholderiaceae bacterium]